jgi:hypothetical protein
MNHNLIDTRPYNRDTYLDIFETLHNVDDIPPYPGWPQDNQYYGRHMNTFMNDMQGLSHDDRAQFNQILGRVRFRRRGPSELKERMIALNGTLNPIQNQNVRVTGGKRSSRKGQRRSNRKSRNNKIF